MSALIEFDHVCKYYQMGDTLVKAADHISMQVYLWYKGTYYPTTLSQVNGEEHTLIGWYDGGLRAAGGKIRVLIAVRKN